MRLLETHPSLEVEEAEYTRLLGLPRGHVLEEPLDGLARWAREWYEENGRPWISARRVERLEVSEDTTRVESTELSSPHLTARLQRAGATTAVVAAAGAGPEAEEEAGRLWRAGHPDRYFFLETYASAVVEALLKRLAAHLCSWADERGLAALPPYSPGYRGWPLTDQHALLDLVRGAAEPLPSALEVLASGQLRPKKSQLALFGLAPESEETTRRTELIPCTTCSYSPCRYRRAPYQRLEYDPEEERPTGPNTPWPGGEG
jgi:hypothetical protein